MITQAAVQSLLDYKDGALYWKDSTPVSSYRDTRGYMRIGLNKKRYLQHRIIYLMFYGHLPRIVDHIDGDPTNNKIQNLRAATNAENLQNMRLHPETMSGCKNVSWDKKARKWVVMLVVNGVKKYFGLFKDLELADLVATEARDKFHGKFARHA